MEARVDSIPIEKFIRSYCQAKRSEETEHADCQHRERSRTYWYHDDGTLALHARFLPETGTRIRSALDAVMEIPESEQSASQWRVKGRL